MYKIGIIVDKDFIKDSMIRQVMKKIYDTYGNTATIYSGGTEGGEYLVKRLAIESGMKYGEFNPSYTGKNLYSFESPEYYGKNYHGSQIIHRYHRLVQHSEKIMIFMNEGNSFLKGVIKYCNKLKKDCAILI